MPTKNNSPRTPAHQTKSKLLKIDRNQIALQDAFDFQFRLADSDLAQAEIDNERAIRAVGYLLAYSSEYGNQSIAGDAALGLSRVLDVAARNIAVTAKLRKGMRCA